jgi:hypothetical protein
MAELTNDQFMSPYEVSNYLSGVIEGRQKNKQTFLFDQFGDRDTTEDEFVNLDKERDEKNVSGEYVHPKVDASYIQLPDFGTQRLGFAYAKEALNTDDFITLNQRELGQPFGQVDINGHDSRRLQKKLANALNAFDVLKERASRDILFYGTHTASGPKASTVKWDLGRVVATTDTEYLNYTASAIDLTTLNANGGSGKRAWGSTGGTVPPTPYKDMKNMVQVAMNRGKPITKFVMSTNAYDLLEADILANYKDAANLEYVVMQRIELKILPEVEMYDGLTFRRMLPIGVGQSVPIYTYTNTYHDRITGASTAYVPTGYVVGIPAMNNQMVRYGRIMHRKARWQAMPVWINTWENMKTGDFEQELHTSFVIAAYDINSVISWKVA